MVLIVVKSKVASVAKNTLTGKLCGKEDFKIWSANKERAASPTADCAAEARPESLGGQCRCHGMCRSDGLLFLKTAAALHARFG